jgi:surfactin synthase thioesterase subunit
VGDSLVAISTAAASGRVLVCIPQAGAGAFSFLSLAQSLQPHVSVCAARFPGRESRILERPLATIEEMAASLTEPVKGIDAHSIAFFGHCSGALVAYELACMLSAEGWRWPSAWLVVSSQSAPGRSGGGSPETQVPVSRLDVTSHLRAMGGTPEKLLRNSELIRLLAPAIEAESNAVERYRVPECRPNLEIPIAVVAGRNDEFLQGADIASWGGYTAGLLKIEYFDGGHFILADQEESVGEFLRNLLGCEQRGA